MNPLTPAEIRKILRAIATTEARITAHLTIAREAVFPAIATAHVQAAVLLRAQNHDRRKALRLGHALDRTEQA